MIIYVIFLSIDFLKELISSDIGNVIAVLQTHNEYGNDFSL